MPQTPTTHDSPATPDSLAEMKFIDEICAGGEAYHYNLGGRPDEGGGDEGGRDEGGGDEGGGGEEDALAVRTWVALTRELCLIPTR